MGLFLLDKPTGISSNKALSEFKKNHNVTKAGFSGVLDPFASGLLIVATNSHTKLLDIFLNKEKTYTGKILFGKTTNTLDTEGEIIDEISDVNLTLDEINDKIKEKFIGEIKQVPPIFSNIKVNGKRARELAIKNHDVVLQPKNRIIYSFEIKSYKSKIAEFEVKVSSGTYIRKLAFDLGETLGYPSMLISLRRTKIGNILVDNKEIDPYVFSDLNTIKINDIQCKNLLDGKEENLKVDLKEFIALNNIADIWVKKIDDDKFKIYKRLK